MNLTGADYQVLLFAFSEERMGRYLQLTGGDLPAAIQFHHLDALLAAELTVSLKVTELSIRNAIHDVLSNDIGSTYWFHNPSFGWRERERKKLEQAEKRAGQYSGTGVKAGKVISELTFGFWIGCFAPTYEHKLWHPHLKRLFPDPRIKRQHVFDRLNALFLIRNRAAHHETILPDRAITAIANTRFVLSNLRPKRSPVNDSPATLRILEGSFATIAKYIDAMRALTR